MMPVVNLDLAYVMAKNLGKLMTPLYSARRESFVLLSFNWLLFQVLGSLKQ